MPKAIVSILYLPHTCVVIQLNSQRDPNTHQQWNAIDLQIIICVNFLLVDIFIIECSSSYCSRVLKN